MKPQPGKPTWTWTLTTLGTLSVVLLTGRCSNTAQPEPVFTSDEAYRQMALVMGDGGGGGGPPDAGGGGGGGGGVDGGSGGDGGNSLCSQFTLCQTDADCVGSPSGPTCTPCPACGKHCWGGGGGGGGDGGADGGVSCTDGGTKCICIYGNCSYNSDCPAGTACTGGKCKDGGSEYPPNDKADCDAWIADAGANCTVSQVLPMGVPFNGIGCDFVNVQYMGHSSSGQCNSTIYQAFALCLDGCSVSYCNNGCMTFANQAQAEATFDLCRDTLDQMGIPYAISITGNQALASCSRTSHMELSCMSGFPTQVTYQSCDPAGRCYWVGETTKCTRDGGTLDQVCCAGGGGDPVFVPGATTCPLRPCSDLKDGGTCWGRANPTTSACSLPDGDAGQVVCCGADGGVTWIEHGTWKDRCN